MHKKDRRKIETLTVSRSTGRQTDREQDRQTDRQTDGRSGTNLWWTKFFGRLICWNFSFHLHEPFVIFLYSSLRYDPWSINFSMHYRWQREGPWNPKGARRRKKLQSWTYRPFRHCLLDWIIMSSETAQKFPRIILRNVFPPAINDTSENMKSTDENSVFLPKDERLNLIWKLFH